MDKLAFVDIGELGWSLYLTAHVRWLKKNTNSQVAVISLPDRKCLYRGLADEVVEVPDIFYKKYDIKLQDCFGLNLVDWNELRSFFLPYVPTDYHLADYVAIGCEKNAKLVFDNRFTYAPYGYSKPPEDKKEIMIFPRYRFGGWARRNLPRGFYSRLISWLCDEFPALTVRAIGTESGAYDIKIDRLNYINWIGKSESLQDLIDRCQSAVAAVGSQSSPPKITLLQGVPTIMIGHQEGRHTVGENWLGTKAGFYAVGKRAYAKFDVDDCIAKIILFVRGCL